MTIKAKFFLFVSRDYIVTQTKKNLAFIFIVWRIYILMFGCKRLKLEVLSILIGNIFFCFSSLFSCLCISPSIKTLFVSVWPEFYVVLAILTNLTPDKLHAWWRRYHGRLKSPQQVGLSSRRGDEMFLSVMKVLIDYMYLFAVPPKRTGKKGHLWLLKRMFQKDVLSFS